MNKLYNVKCYFSSLISSLYFEFEKIVSAENEKEARTKIREKIRQAKLDDDNGYVAILSIEEIDIQKTKRILTA